MVWDASKPSGSQKIRLSDEEIRANWEALEDALSREHVFPGSLGSTAGMHKVPVVTNPPTGYEGRLAIINNAFTYYSNGQWRYGVPSGTKMVFVQPSAPAGWTQDTNLNDRVLRVVSGAGGNTGGSWTISGLQVEGHALTVEQIPPHTHTVTVKGTFRPAGPDSPADVWRNESTGTTGSTGGGQPHSHGLSSDGTWRPSYVDAIVAVKN